MRSLVAAVEAYEAAQKVPATIPNPVIGDPPISNSDYAAALTIVSGASAVTVAQALWRSPKPADPTALARWNAAAATVQSALASAAAAPLASDPRPVPSSIDMWQAQVVLAEQNLLGAANNAIAAANDPALTTAWGKAASLNRNSPALASMASAIGLTTAQVDSLFRQAGALTV